MNVNGKNMSWTKKNVKSYIHIITIENDSTKMLATDYLCL